MPLTREKIIELGESLIVTMGYNAFSYQSISKELGIKNAAVHYYFPAKANLGTSIVRTSTQRFEEMVDNMNTMKFDEWKKLDTFLKVYIKSYRENKICILGSLGPDYNTLNEVTQRELVKMTEIILNWLTGLLENGRNNKTFHFKGDPSIKAAVLLSSLMGSLQLSRVLDKLDYKAICQTIKEDLML